MGDTPPASGVWPRDAASWASIPTEFLLAELSKRHGHAGADADAANANATKPQCGSSRKESYDTPLHIGALILILALSTIACGIPLLPRRTSKGRPQSIILFYCQHFGTGVLLATSFVHLLPTAFTSLTDPCLPSVFNRGYPQMAGLVAMVAALSVVALESYLATRGAGHSHSHSHEYEYWDEEDNAQHSPELDTHAAGSMASHRHGSHRPEDINLDNMESTQSLMAGASPLPSSTPTQAKATHGLANDRDSFDDDASDIDLDVNELDPVVADGPRRRSSPGSRPKIVVTPGAGAGAGAPQVVTEEEQAKLLRQCLLLEGGILFHSVFIGMAISVATGPTFIVFLIAISFHQTFEGLALGSRIAAIQLPRSSVRPWLMVLAFGGTTPLGQLIGLIVHNLYDPMSQTGLLMVGFMNSISAGLLLFAGLVQLLAEDFLSEKSYKTLVGRKRLKAYLAVVGGASLMALVGAFA